MAVDLSRGPVPTHLRRQGLPMALGLVALVSFDAVDLFFIAQLGDAPLAAISFTFPVIWLFSSIVIGLEAGAASVISRAVGAGNNPLARRQTTDTALLAGLLSLLLCVLGLLTLRPLFSLLGAGTDLQPLIADYMRIWYWSAPVAAVTWTCLASIRARGNTLLEGKIITVAAVLNAILDPLLIFGLLGFPRLGIAGAALATLIANLVVLCGTLYYLHTRLRVFATPFTTVIEVVQSWIDMLRVGLPAMATHAIVPVANGIAVAMIATYGVDAVAGFGVAARIEPLALLAFYALSAVTAPFMGQNSAAGVISRLDEARWVIARFCVIYGAAVAVLLVLVAGPLAALFTDNPAIRDIAVLYLWIMAFSYGGYGMVMAMCSAFNGVGHPLPGLMLSACRALLLFLPLALAGQWLIGLNGIFLASAAANVLLGLAAFVWFGHYVRATLGDSAPSRVDQASAGR